MAEVTYGPVPDDEYLYSCGAGLPRAWRRPSPFPSIYRCYPDGVMYDPAHRGRWQTITRLALYCETGPGR